MPHCHFRCQIAAELELQDFLSIVIPSLSVHTRSLQVLDKGSVVQSADEAL